jgi:hypothetical protein
MSSLPLVSSSSASIYRSPPPPLSDIYISLYIILDIYGISIYTYLHLDFSIHISISIIIMTALVLNGFPPAPHQRQNRRRERPGSRTRRTLTRKSNIQDACVQGIYDARDATVYLPSDKPTPSPLLRQSFDQSWERWKAREAEQKALAEMDQTQLELEQQRLFGGDVDDDVSLCESMLQVVMDLFGDLDYADP